MSKNKMKDIVQRLNYECKERKKIEKKLKQRLTFEKTISAVSSRFIAVKNINKAINNTLRDIGRLSGASRAYLFLLNKDGTRMTNTHEWCRKGVSPQKHNLQDAPVTLVSYGIAKLRKGEVVHVPDVSKLPKSANKDKKLMQKQDIKSMLVVPLYKAAKLIGFAGFDNVAETGEWNNDDLILLHLCSDIVMKAFESKEAEDKLKESEANFRQLAEQNPNMIYIHDFQGIVYANQKAVDVMNYSRKEGYSKDFNFMDFIAPEFRPKIKEVVIQHIKGKDIEPFECALITKNGKKLDVIIATKLINYRGKSCALGIVTDITDRKKSEEALKESEAKFRTLFNSAKDAIFLSDKTGRFIDVNEAACKILNYPKNKLLKLCVKDVHLDPRGYKEFQKMRAGKIKEARFGIKRLRKDGTYQYIDMLGTSIKANSQKIFLAIARDITKLKNSEVQIKEYSEKLEEKVKERTKELTSRIDELERFHNVTVGRELKMIELKEKIKELERNLSAKEK